MLCIAHVHITVLVYSQHQKDKLGSYIHQEITFIH